jgi:7-carboxy-7-deazaguanine synthase
MPPRRSFSLMGGIYHCYWMDSGIFWAADIAPTQDLVHLLPPSSAAPMPSTLPPSGEKLLVSETFVSLQGEGVSSGAPAAFLRLGNCNLACSFCDTPYTWDGTRFDLSEELRARNTSDVAEWLLKNSPGRLIVTGGEPLLQQKQLGVFFREIDERSAALGRAREVIEVETNGTVRPLVELLSRVDQWNVSPKLKNSGEPEESRLRPAALSAFWDSGRAYFKFVVQQADDVLEVDALVERYGWSPERVLLMPEATTAALLRERSPRVAEEALRRRYRFSSRVHLELYGGRRGT